MARTRAQTAAQRGRPLPAPNDQGRRPQGIPSRKSAPRKLDRLPKQPATKRAARNRPRPSTINETLSQQDNTTLVQSRGRKRKQPVDTVPEPSIGPAQKRQRTSHARPAVRTCNEPPTVGTSESATDPIRVWVTEGRWPEEQCWPEEPSEKVPTMERLLARRKSSSYLSRKRSNSASSMTPSDQKPREEKSAPYRDPRYKTLLEIKGSYMTKSPLDLADASQAVCRSLLGKMQPVPGDTLFRDDIFEATCEKIYDKNEARVIQDVTRLIVPSAESLATFGAKHLDILTESVNEGWNNSIPFTSTRPQPDYSVGFRREAFTEEQLTKLSPFIGDFITGDQSLFMATYYMYFPFLTCEVKCGAAALDTADRQNAHSMTLAVRATAELFRAVNREGEVHRQILAFSISHDDRSVRIYGHYPVLDGKDIKYYRQPIRTFDFTELDGKEKWTAYRFTKNVYDTWMPAHFKRICSAIDQLPSESNFDFPLPPETGLSQDLESLMQSDVPSASLPIDRDNQSSNARQAQAATPGTSFTEPQLTKKRRGAKT
ncbi:uncharacterized protein E0L32_008268 [Thyridium curvatum]|uniref:DUF7924 domain-containing protein n=1 Tax=Thyridium curvatum TaxID=1093900 RepID=A0A507B098_9PEZI|nr:uncharacterized protein E0L32_008268 [Thyridium curvatum]TPX10699.1 hypothetical protein E0L32_008268 [Thyridium curvatum]